jgi:hypothetical protein
MGRWTVDMLPEPQSDRVTAGETIGEVVTTLLTIGGLILLRDLAWLTDDAGNPLPILDPALGTFWLPLLIAVMASIAIIQVLVYMVGRWTYPLAVGCVLLELAFAIPVVYLALNGMLINPAFAERIGWSELAEGDGWVMLLVALFTTVATAWEVFDVIRRARRSHRSRVVADLRQTSV